MHEVASPRIWVTSRHRPSLLTHTGLEEAAADPLVGADGMGHLLHVRPGDLTQRADGVDATDALCQEGIGRLREREDRMGKDPSVWWMSQ